MEAYLSKYHGVREYQFQMLFLQKNYVIYCNLYLKRHFLLLFQVE